MSLFDRKSSFFALAALTALAASACDSAGSPGAIEYVINGVITDDATPAQPVILGYRVAQLCCAGEAVGAPGAAVGATNGAPAGAPGICRDVESGMDGIFHHVGYLEKTADGRDLEPASKIAYRCLTDAAHPPSLRIQGQLYPIKIEDVNGRPSGDLAQDLGSSSIMEKASARLPKALADRLNSQAWGRDPGVTAASGDVPGLLGDAQRRLEVSVTLTKMVRTPQDQRDVERVARLIAGDAFVQAFKDFSRQVMGIRYVDVTDGFSMEGRAIDVKDGFMYIAAEKPDAQILSALTGTRVEQQAVSGILSSAAAALGVSGSIDDLDPSVVLVMSKAVVEAKARAWAAALRAPTFARSLADFQTACGGRPGHTTLRLVDGDFGWEVTANRVESRVSFHFSALPQSQLALLGRAVAGCRRTTPPGVGTASSGPDPFAGAGNSAPAPGSQEDIDNHLSSAGHALGVSSVGWGPGASSTSDRRIALLVDSAEFGARFAELKRQCGRGAAGKLYLSDHFGLDSITLDFYIDMRRSNADMLATLAARAVDCERAQQYFDSQVAPAAGSLKVDFAMDLVLSQGVDVAQQALARWAQALQGAGLQSAVSELVASCKVDQPIVLFSERTHLTYAEGAKSGLIEWNALGSFESQQPAYARLARRCKGLSAALDRLNAAAVAKGLAFIDDRPDSDTTDSRIAAIGDWSAFFLADPSRLDQFRQVIERSDYLRRLPKRCLLDAAFPAALGSVGEDRCSGRPPVTEIGFGGSWSYDSWSKRVQVNLTERPKVPAFVRIDGMYDTSFDGPSGH